MAHAKFGECLEKRQKDRSQKSLSYDELHVCPCHSSQHVFIELICHLCVGFPHPVRKEVTQTRHNPNVIQLRVGSCKEPSP